MPECLYERDRTLIGETDFNALPGTKYVAGLCLICKGASSYEVEAKGRILGVTERPSECRAQAAQDNS